MIRLMILIASFITCALMGYETPPRLSHAKELYYEGRYQQAYHIFVEDSLREYFGDEMIIYPPEFIDAFIGKIACEEKLGYDEQFKWDFWKFMCYLVNPYIERDEDFYDMFKKSLFKEIGK